MQFQEGDRVTVGRDIGTIDEIDSDTAAIVWDRSGCVGDVPVSSLKPLPPMEAYAVTENDEGTGAIYFARHAVVARRMGANEYTNGDFSYVTCRRAPWADAYVDKPLPAKVMVDHGWHFECHGCGKRIDDDMPYEHGMPIEGIIGSQHSAVYCCGKCYLRDQRMRARRKVEETAASRISRRSCASVSLTWSSATARTNGAAITPTSFNIAASGIASKWLWRSSFPACRSGRRITAWMVAMRQGRALPDTLAVTVIGKLLKLTPPRRGRRHDLRPEARQEAKGGRQQDRP